MKRLILAFLIIFLILLTACSKEPVEEAVEKVVEKIIPCSAVKSCPEGYLCHFESELPDAKGKCLVNPEYKLCLETGGEWTECGSGCGPLMVGQDPEEERICPAVCIPQCVCPEEKLFWHDEKGCIEGVVQKISKARLGLIIDPRTEEMNDGTFPYKVYFNAVLTGVDDYDENFYCLKQTWDFGDGIGSDIWPDCESFTEGTKIERLFTDMHAYKKPGKYIVKLQLGPLESNEVTIMLGITPGIPECETDNDCVTTGCSGQICQSEKAEPLVSTCEWKEKYVCFEDKGKCVCREGVCAWTDSVEECLEYY
jgi:eight-cysteine-cluster-containing protein